MLIKDPVRWWVKNPPTTGIGAKLWPVVAEMNDDEMAIMNEWVMVMRQSWPKMSVGSCIELLFELERFKREGVR